jgi:hypothetical protein
VTAETASTTATQQSRRLINWQPMPMPPYVISANVLICERALTESDGVVSAIRMIDIFYVSERPPDLPAEVVVSRAQAFGCVTINQPPETMGSILYN